MPRTSRTSSANGTPSQRRQVELIIDPDEYWQKVFMSSTRADLRSVMISTYGLAVGITSHGSTYESRVADVLDNLARRASKVHTSIIVGLADHDTTQKVTQIVTNCAHVYRDFRWMVCNNLHLKCMIFDSPTKPSVYTGGRNLSYSRWADCSVKITTPGIVDKMTSLWNAVAKQSQIVYPPEPFKVY